MGGSSPHLTPVERQDGRQSEVLLGRTGRLNGPREGKAGRAEFQLEETAGRLVLGEVGESEVAAAEAALDEAERAVRRWTGAHDFFAARSPTG